MIVLEEKEVHDYLKKRKFLLKSYYKARDYLEKGFLKNIYFKKRKPKSGEEYQFRINKKYRAFGYFREDNFIIVEINDHQ